MTAPDLELTSEEKLEVIRRRRAQYRAQLYDLELTIELVASTGDPQETKDAMTAQLASQRDALLGLVKVLDEKAAALTDQAFDATPSPSSKPTAPPNGNRAQRRASAAPRKRTSKAK